MQVLLMQLTEDITNLILVMVSVVATSIIGYFSIEYSKRQHERSVMSEVFQMVDSQSHKTAEENIRNAYANNTLMRNGKLNPDHANPAEVISQNYAQVGSLMSSRLVPKRQYYEKFGVITVMSYITLKEVIEKEREDGYVLHRAYFTILAIDCFEYWDGLRIDDKPIEIKDPKGNRITREMLGKRIKVPRKRFA